jgi:hypothetical protein
VQVVFVLHQTHIALFQFVKLMLGKLTSKHFQQDHITAHLILLSCGAMSSHPASFNQMHDLVSTEASSRYVTLPPPLLCPLNLHRYAPFEFLVGFLASEFHSDTATNFIYLYIKKAAIHQEDMMKQFPYVLGENRSLGMHSSVLFMWDGGYRKYHFRADRFAPHGYKEGLHVQCPTCKHVGTVDLPNTKYNKIITLRCLAAGCDFEKKFDLENEPKETTSADGVWTIQRRTPVLHVTEWMVEVAALTPSEPAKRPGQGEDKVTKRARKAGK